MNRDAFLQAKKDVRKMRIMMKKWNVYVGMLLMGCAVFCGCGSSHKGEDGKAGLLDEISKESRTGEKASKEYDNSVRNDVQDSGNAAEEAVNNAGRNKNDNGVTSSMNDEENSLKTLFGTSDSDGSIEEGSHNFGEMSGEETAEQEELEKLRIRHQYADVLSQLICTYQLPDGEMLESVYEWNADMSDNSYAILDVDGDGREELVISYSTGSMADMFEAVYDYDPKTDTLTQELRVFPWVEYYDNGKLLAYASHNHSYGDFWPVGLYQYDAGSNTYIQSAYVDTWDKNLWESIYDYETGGQILFPEELDTDHDGILYRIQEGDSEDYLWSERSYRSNEEDYQKWYDSHMQGAEKLTVEYKSLSYDNFQSYTQEYLSLLWERKERKDPSDGTDIGMLFIREDVSLEEISRMLQKEYALTITYPYAEVEEEWSGISQGKEVFAFSTMNAGSMNYQHSKIGDVTIFDLYPGMEEERALEKLSAYGFYLKQGDEQNGYLMITGKGLGNISIWYKAQNGRLTDISIYPYCEYAG